MSTWRTSSCRPRGRCLAIGLALVAVLAAPGLRAQEELQASRTSQQSALALTPTDVEARIAEVAARTDLASDVQAQATALWRQVLSAVQQADEARHAAAEWDAARNELPTRLAEIRAQLEAPLPTLPQVPPDADLALLESRLGEAQAQLAAANTLVADLELERKHRSEQRLALPKAMSEARQRLEQLATEPPVSEDLPAVAEARSALVKATRESLALRIETDEKELLSYESRTELLRARQDLAARRQAEATALADLWQGAANERRRQDAQAAEEQARAVSRAAADAHPVVAEQASRNEVLAARRTELTVALERNTTELASLRLEAQRLGEQSGLVHSRVDRAGFTNAIAVLLQRHRSELPDSRAHRRRVTELQETTGRLQLESLDLEDEREDLGTLDQSVDRMLAEVDQALPEASRADIRSATRALLEKRREMLDGLLDDLDTYLDGLIDLGIEEQLLVDQAREYERFIAEHVLWVRSTDLIAPRSLLDTAAALAWLLDPSAWLGTATAMLADARADPTHLAVTLAGLLLCAGAWPFARRRLRSLGAEAAHARLLKVRTLLAGLGLTALRAVSVPCALWIVGWRLKTVLTPMQGTAVGQGLQDVASALLPISSLASLCQAHGLGEAVLKWTQPTLKAVRRHLGLLVLILMPALLVAFSARHSGEEAYDIPLSRLTLTVAWVTLAVVSGSLLRSTGPLMRALDRRPSGWLIRLKPLWRTAAVGAPAALAVATQLGFLYAGHELGRRLLETWALVLGLLVGHGLIIRWLAMQRRQLRLEQALRRREAGQAASEAGAPAVAQPQGEVAAVADDLEPELDLVAVDAQVQQLVRAIVGFALLLGLGIIWADVLPALAALDGVTLWTTLAPAADAATAPAVRAVTLADLGLALAVLLLTFLASKNLPGVLEVTLLRRLPLEPGGGYAVTTICRYLLTIVGFVAAFGIIGITWGKVQFLAAAITVGLGFGLQEIFANFVSGLMILFERPVRVGDIITVGTTDGVVTRIRMRATTIRDWDRRELLVPNKELITGRVVNWTLSDPVTRVVFPVGVAFGSDTARTTRTLLEIARQHPLVLGNPEPSVVFRSFGDSTLAFELRVFIGSMDSWPQVTHEINSRIDARLREAGIQIAFPQRDLHVRTFGAALELRGAQPPPTTEVAAPRPSVRRE